jgi:hypothetical protein
MVIWTSFSTLFGIRFILALSLLNTITHDLNTIKHYYSTQLNTKDVLVYIPIGILNTIIHMVGF